MKVTISKEILISAHSVSAGASKEDMTPVIQALCFTREGDSLRVLATDRYVIMSGTYQDVQFDDWEEGANLLVDHRRLKSVVDYAKRVKWATPVTLEDGTMSVEKVTTTVAADTGSATFPPVAKIFPTNTPNGATELRLNVEFLTRLGKIIPPVVKPGREKLWEFSFSHNTDNAKPLPVLAVSAGSDYTMQALIQPNLMKR
jgi:hypothetical protein